VLTVDAAFTNAARAPQQIAAGTLFVILSNSGGGGGGGGGMPPTAALWMFGIVSPAQVASQTVIDIPHLAGFQDDTFNDDFYMQILHAGGAAPEGEKRIIQDYDGGLGRFTTDAFSANVEAGDIVAIYHTAIEAIDIVARGTLTLSDLLQPEDNTRTESNDAFRGCLLMPTEGAAAFQPRLIRSYTGAGGIFDLDSGNPFADAPGLVDYVILKHQEQFVPLADAAENRIPADVIGNKADAAVVVVGVVASLMAYIKGILNGVNHNYQEQADTAVNITAIAGGETDVLNLAVANTRYIVRSLRLKCADPAANTVTVRLYELVNDVATVVHTYDITAANFGTYLSLMDLFGLSYLSGDNLRVTVQGRRTLRCNGAVWPRNSYIGVNYALD